MTSVIKSLFGGGRRKGSFDVAENNAFTVRYIGNVFTQTTKGDGCVDKSAAQLWKHYKTSPSAGLRMKLHVTNSGMRAWTDEQGLTEYHANKITYVIAHPRFPKLFCWVYRHQRKVKIEFRCHAVLCSKEVIAKALAVLVHQRIQSAFNDFKRQKRRQQEYRLRQEKLRTNLDILPPTGSPSSLPKNKVVQQSFKAATAPPTLDMISEDGEDEEEDETPSDVNQLPMSESDTSSEIEEGSVMDEQLSCSSFESSGIVDTSSEVDIEFGNNLDSFAQDRDLRPLLVGDYSNGEVLFNTHL